MGWLVSVLKFFWAKKGLGFSGCVILVASASYTDHKMKEQEKTNVRLERGLVTVNDNLFKLMIAVLTKKEQPLEKIEEPKEK